MEANSCPSFLSIFSRDEENKFKEDFTNVVVSSSKCFDVDAAILLDH